jgi:hypothetical protein
VLLAGFGINGPSHSQQRESEWNPDYRGARAAKANRAPGESVQRSGAQATAGPSLRSG